MIEFLNTIRKIDNRSNFDIFLFASYEMIKDKNENETILVTLTLSQGMREWPAAIWIFNEPSLSILRHESLNL